MEKPQRILALDAFRGITIAAMIMVNQPGSWNYVYSQMRHSEWNGCTLTDLIFPFFLVIMGVAIWFSFQRNDQKPSWALVMKIIRRTLLIFLIGFILNLLDQIANKHVVDLSTLRFMGVFQRIAFCYGIGGVLCLVMGPKQLVLTSALILIGYWLILWGFGGPDPYTPTTTVVGKIDAAILGTNHLHGGHALDPTGLFSSIPAVVHVLWGYLLGRMISLKADRKDLVLSMFILGIPPILAAQVWDYFFPINKTLWTSSYVLYTTGWAFITLAFFIWLMDIKQIKKWAYPLLVFGINPLFAYIFASLWVKVVAYWMVIPSGGKNISIQEWLYDSVCVPLAGNLNGSLLYSILTMIFYWAILSVLYNKKIYIKI
jgi:predicted acyltransferase